MANKRIIDLTEIQNIEDDDYVILDSNTDGTRKILASNIGGDGGGVNYSTTEQDTGLKWIDGKPIYQKTFNIPAADTYIDLTSLSIDNLVRVDGLIKTTSNAVLGVFASVTPDYVCNLEIDYHNMRMQLLMSGWAFASGYATIYYTKTTDTV